MTPVDFFFFFLEIKKTKKATLLVLLFRLALLWRLKSDL